MTNLDSVKNKRHHFAEKVLYSQGYSLSSSHVWMWELDNKKAECWRINVFKLWCWRRVPWESLESPLESKAIKPVNRLKEVNPEYSLEGLMLKLKPQYFEYLMWTDDSLEKTHFQRLIGKIEGRRRKGWQRMRWLDGITNSVDMNSGDDEGQVSLVCCSPWDREDSDMTLWLNNNKN